MEEQNPRKANSYGWGPLLSAVAFVGAFLGMGGALTLVFGFGPHAFGLGLLVGILWQLCLIQGRG